jgi:hypothetical protein
MTGRQVSLAPVWLTREQFFVVVRLPLNKASREVIPQTAGSKATTET